ncbi:MAG: pyridoxal-dependent decarboxylase [Acidimicrobiales bacterium]
MSPPGDHMTPDEFRRSGRAVVDWLADYYERLESLPVLAPVAPGEIRARLPAEAPERGEPFAAILDDVDAKLLDGVTHWQHPSFFGYFPANASGPSILGELLSAGLAVQGMLWSTSPACTELETHVLGWLARLCALPERLVAEPAGAVIQDSASSAALCAIVAARERARRAGADPATLTAYLGAHTHSSVEKGLRVAGVGGEQLRLVDSGAGGGLDPAALAAALARDAAEGRRPFFVCATAGATASLVFDPVAAVAAAATRYGAWVHVDGALAGAAAVCSELRFVNAGLDRVDSYCFNPHKWLLTNFDCDCFYVADRAELVSALSILPDYLRNAATESGQVIDYRDWQVPLGRRFRALKLWFVLRWYGAEGLRRHIRRGVALAEELAGWVAEDPEWELAAPPRLSLVCLRSRAGDDATQAALDRVNASGAAFVTHARVDGRLALRVAVGAPLTERRHLEALWAAVRTAAA